MSEPIEYGVFQVGQIWRVVGGTSNQLGFASRECAIAAADLLVAAHGACGDLARVVVQDDLGRLVPAPDAFRLPSVRSTPRACS